MALTPEEIERYKRHLVLREVGGQGQQKIKAAKVLVVGAGGLGSPLLMYLAAAGVGTIGIVDDDRVSLDNLQRQIVHDTAARGVAKVESARDMIARLNPHVRVETHDTRDRRRQRAGDDRRLRYRRRRLRQFRHPLPGERCLLSGQAARWCSRRSAPSTAT